MTTTDVVGFSPDESARRAHDRDEARAEAIGWLVSSIDEVIPGFVGAQATRAKLGDCRGADVLRDWAKRLGKPKPRFRSESAAEKAVVKALVAAGFEKVMPGVRDEPTVSVQIGKDRWVDVFVREATR